MKIISKIKKYYWAVAIIFIIPSILLADTGADSGYILENPISVNSLPELIKSMFDAIIQIGLVFVILAIIYAGLQFVMAQGNSEKITKAKSIFLWTIIGGVILLGASAISGVVCNTANQFLTTPISC
jgi:hypothetical protein